MKYFDPNAKIILSRRICDSKEFKLLQDVKFNNIIVHTGFITDGASIKHIGRYTIGCPFEGIYLAPAIIHDGLYASELFDRKSCDKVFYHALLDVGVPKWKAYLMYKAVRVGGFFVWLKHTEESVYNARQHVRTIGPNYALGIE